MSRDVIIAATDGADRAAQRARAVVPVRPLAILAGVVVGTVAALGPTLGSRAVALALGAIGAVVLLVIGARHFWWLLLVLFAVRPILDGFQPSEPGGSGLQAGTIVGAVFLVAAVVWLIAQWRTRELTRVSTTTIAFMAAAVLLTISALGATDVQVSLQNASKILAGAVMLMVLEQIFTRDLTRIRPLLLAMFGSLLVPAVVGYIQLATRHGDPNDATQSARIQSTFAHPNEFATYLVTLVLIAFALFPHVSDAWRAGLGLSIAVALPLVVGTYARGAWIALAVGLLFIGLAQARPLIFGLLIVTVVVIVAVPSVSGRFTDLTSGSDTINASATSSGQQVPDSLSWRVGYWGRIFPMWKTSPVIGIGPGMVEHNSPEQLAPHNSFLESLIEGGVLGLIAILVTMALIWRQVLRAGRLLTHGVLRGLAIAAAAAGLALFTQFFSENLLTAPVLLWYFLVPLAWVGVATRRVQAGDAPTGAQGLAPISA